MSESDVDALIADVYDAALDRTLWPRIMEKICRYVQGHGAGLLAEDGFNADASLYYDYGYDPHWTKLYIDKYVAMNPLPRIGIVVPVGEVFTQYDLIPEAEFRASQFYKEWAQPQGFVDVAVVNLEKSATSFAALVVTRQERDGIFDEPARARMARIAPHVRRSVLVGKTILFHKTEAALLSETLSTVSAAVFLVAAGGRIVFANESARTMLREGAIFRDDQGALTATNAQSHRALREAIAGSGDANLGTRGVAIELALRQEERWLAHVLPLTSGTRQRAGAAAAAAVFVRKAALDLQFPLETLGKLYNLTAGELRVLQAVVEVGGIPAIADKHGVSESTVRTHMKSIFDKTGVKRQADLIKLIATHASPFGA